jgi:predicted Zn-dependent peptidase
MAFKGTTTKTAKEIAEKVDNVGGFMNAFTSEETTAYFVQLLEQNLQVGIDVISDILQNSTFEPEELEKERGVILQEIGMYLDDPSEMVGDYWQRTAFPNQPIGRLIIGKKEIIQSIKRDKIVNFMQNNYHPSKMVVSAAGKINHENFVEQISNSMINLPNGNINKRVKAFYQGGEYREEKALEQVHLVLGFKGLDYYDEDYYALKIYSAIMGAGMSSRLFQEIREKRGLVYSIHTSSRSFYDTGTFQVFAGTGEKQIQELIPVLCDELQNAPKNLTDKEIEKSKTQLRSATLMATESTMSNAAIAVHQIFTKEKLINIEETLEKIKNVSKSSIEKAAKKLLSSKPTVSSIGPIQQLENLDNITKRLN